MDTSYVTLKLYSISIWQDKDLESLVFLLDSHDLFRPDKWGPYEPLKFKFSQSEVANIQTRWKTGPGLGLLFGKSISRFSLSISKKLHIKRPNVMTVFIEDEFFIREGQTEIFLSFVKKLIEWSNAVYGYGCHRRDFEQKNILSMPTRIEGKLIATGGMDIRRCLPGIYWANFFGSHYINWFGESKFQNLPAHSQQDLSKGGRLILSSGSPLDYEQRIVMERESLIRKGLGERAFFDIRNPTRVTDSPFKDGFLRIE